MGLPLSVAGWGYLDRRHVFPNALLFTSQQGPEPRASVPWAGFFFSAIPFFSPFIVFVPFSFIQ